MFGSMVVIGFAILFYRAAAYERMAAWKWAGGSLLLSFVVGQIASGMALLVVAQTVLLGALWRQNMKKVEGRHQEWTDRQAEDQRIKQERVRRAHETIEQERQAREA